VIYTLSEKYFKRVKVKMFIGWGVFSAEATLMFYAIELPLKVTFIAQNINVVILQASLLPIP